MEKACAIELTNLIFLMHRCKSRHYIGDAKESLPEKHLCDKPPYKFSVAVGTDDMK